MPIRWDETDDRAYTPRATPTPSAPASPAPAPSPAGGIRDPSVHYPIQVESDPWSGFNKQLDTWFQQYLKRTPGSGEYPLHQGTPGVTSDNWASWAPVERAITGSQEYQGLQTAPPPPTPPTPRPGPPGGDYQGWFSALTQGQPPTPASLIALEPTLAQHGITVLRNGEGTAGKIRLPDGRIVDVIVGASRGGEGWSWQTDIGGGPSTSGGPGPMPGVPAVPLTPTESQYTDPYTTQLEDFVNYRLGELYRPVNDPFRDQYASLLQGRTDSLNANEGAVKQLLDYLQGRFTELQTPGRTGAEQEVINTQAIEPLQLERAAAKRKMVEQLAARNIPPESGIFQEALLSIDRAFDGALAQTRSGLTADELARREARLQEAGQVGASLVDIPDARSREALGTAEQLSTLSSSVRGEEEARRNQALSLVGFLANLGPERMQQAMSALGITGATPTSSLDSLLKIAGLNNQTTAVNNKSSAGFWSGLGSIAALLGQNGNTGNTWTETRGSNVTYVPR